MNIEYILNGHLFKVWGKFILASVVGVVLTALYVMVDGIFVGQGAGEAGLAGVNLAWPAVTVILGAGLMLGTGASSVISIALGQQDEEKAKRILGTVLKFSLILGIVLSIVGVMSVDYITAFLGATEDTYSHTRDYFLIIYIMAVPYLLSSVLNPLVRADGQPNLSMIMVGVGAIGNIVLDWLFVLVLGWGTGGAALATGAGVILSTLVGLHYFIKGNSHIKFEYCYFKIDLPLLKEIVKIGFVSFMIQLSIGAVILIQNNIIYTYGNTSDIAIFCVAGYIISLYTQLCVGISQGMQPLIGYHFGADKLKRMRKILMLTLTISVLLGILAVIGLFLKGKWFIGFFGISPDILNLAYERTLIFCIGAPFIGICYTVGAYYQALGRNIAANIVSISRGLILQVAFSVLLPPLIGVQGIFYAQSLSDFCSLFIVITVSLVIYLLDKKNRGRI